jgi:hypothetical protein
MDLQRIFTAAHRELKPRTPPPEIRVEFFPFAGINHTAHLNDGQLRVRVSDIFAVAPEDVHRCLAIILLAKLYRKKVDVAYREKYRTFVLRREIQEMARTARRSRGRQNQPVSPAGRYTHLEPIFDRLNAAYFNGALDKPALSWSRKRSKYILGRYDATARTIFISRLFDSATIPDYVTEYVMYHEMLHIKHEWRVHDCRLIVHTPEFRSDERRFEHYEKARLWLKGI